MNNLPKLFAAISPALFTANVFATEFCAKTSEEFTSALLTASSNNQDDVIKLPEGVFIPPNDDGFAVVVTDGHALTVSGGFTVSGTSCVTGTTNAYRTIVQGMPSKVLLSILPSTASSAPVALRNLAFIGAHGAGMGESAVGVNGRNGWHGDVIVENVAIRGNEALRDVLLVSTQGRVFIRNSEIVENRSSQVGPGNVVSVYAGAPASLGTYLVFNNNTVADNDVDANGYTLELYAGGSGDVQMANNIIWNNGGGDVRVDDYFHMYHNDIRESFGPDPAENVAPLSIEPEFGVNDYRIPAWSPLRNAGISQINGGPIPGGIGLTDVEGVARVLEGAVDIGAHEFDELFSNSFEVIL